MQEASSRLKLDGFDTENGTLSAGIPEQCELELYGKPLQLVLSHGARRAIARLEHPLLVEMELYFSCLIRKRVLFRDPAEPMPDPALPGIEAFPGLRIRLRAVVTETCAIDGLEGAPPVKSMPVARPAAMVPRWLRLQYGQHGWQGEFGY
ncbi:MAG TPA: hypothetical protein ENK53_04920 [Thiotrichales bacterium]|nr:hypothetical protein [Thiotrichales bacterium]